MQQIKADSNWRRGRLIKTAHGKNYFESFTKVGEGGYTVNNGAYVRLQSAPGEADGIARVNTLFIDKKDWNLRADWLYR
eukprot:19825-Heterococcus_DN1.PRE.2